MAQTYDLVIRGGLLADGSGAEPAVADVAIRGGRIVEVGQVAGAGAEEIDARGLLVMPGFIDVHTHYDGQATWESRMAPSSNHGVTTVVTGNCGVGFAPCRPDQHEMLMRLMEGVEDVPQAVMAEGVPWTWETFPEYLDALAARSFDVDVAVQVPHSPIRVFVMGQRGADREPPTDDDLAQMRAITAEAIRAGAIGVTTSRSLTHREKSGALAPSVHSEERELLALAEGLRDAGGGVYQLIPEMTDEAGGEFAVMRRIAEVSGRPVSFSLLQHPAKPESWRDYLRLMAQARADGLEIRGQVFPRPPGTLYGLDLSLTPFFLNPSFQAIADLPLDQKVRALRDPDVRARILSEEPVSENPLLLMQAGRAAKLYPLGNPTPSYEPALETSIGRQAKALGVSANELAYDRLLEDEGRAIYFVPAANYVDGDLKAVRAMMADPNTILGLGDGGAHYGMICDAAFPTYMLTRWVRDAAAGERFPLGQAVRMLSRDPAEAVGLSDRGMVAVGFKADLNVIDLDRLKLYSPRPVFDLPAGGRRLSQKADGYVATIVAGQVTYREGEPTGALPGRLARRLGSTGQAH